MNWINPKVWLLKIGIGLGLRALEKERPLIKEHVHDLVEVQGPKAVDAAIDGLQARAQSAVQRIPFIPPVLKDEICSFIQKEGDAAQSKLDSAIVDGGPAAVDRVIDTLIDTISTKLKTISLN